ncbi:MAG: KH domain-containing protein [Chloroflexi bacterium]|nr:KH domain-containing protein [Chloroflexota bacterium]
MKGLVEYLARELVDHPESVSVSEVRGNQLTILRLRVDPEDMGRIIGRQGRIAQALRLLARVAATREGRRVTLEIG